MTAQHNQGVQDAHRVFLNDLLNSCYIASLSDGSISVGSLGALIVVAHQHSDPTTQILENTSPSALSDEIFDAVYIADQVDSLESAGVQVSQAPAHIDFTHAANVASGYNEPQPAARTYEETEVELLKIAVSNPDLYNNLRQVFVEHKYPEKLDPVGKTLRKFFLST